MSSNPASKMPDYSNMGSRLGVFEGVAMAFLTLSTITVCLRVYVRTRIIRSFQLDDWTMLLSLAMFASYCAVVVPLRRETTSPEASAALDEGIFARLHILELIMRWVLSLFGLYLSLSVVLKISVAISFLRIVVERWQRYTIIISTIIYSLYGMAFCFIAIFQCGKPSEYIIHQAEDKCIDSRIVIHMNYFGSTLNIVTDWIFVGIPIVVIWRSRMPKVTKVTAGLLLSLGALSSICSIVRLRYIDGLAAGPQFLHTSVSIGIWSCVETGLAIIAVSLSTLRPLFKSVLGGSSNQSAVYVDSSRKETAKQSKISSARGTNHHVDGLYRISDDDLCGITTTQISGAKARTKGGRVNESKELGYNVDEVSLEDMSRKPTDATLRQRESEQSLVSASKASQDRIMRTTDVIIH